jgi:hypothetical protein
MWTFFENTQIGASRGNACNSRCGSIRLALVQHFCDALGGAPAKPDDDVPHLNDLPVG